MITRAELIRKIAKHSGVPDSESRVFFEIFLRRLTAVLKPGQALEIIGFGYFYLLQGRINKQGNIYKEENHQPSVIDLIFFSDKKIPDLKNLKGMFFSVPISEEDEFNSVDASFSLSFGKPLIPFKGYVGSDFFIPHIGSELRRLIESKVDKNIDNAEFTEVSEDLQMIIDIDTDIFNKTKSGLDDEIADLTDQHGDDDQITKISEKDLTGVDWGRDLTKQIEEDSILDLADLEETNDNKIKPSLTWDFGSFDEEDDADHEEIEIEKKEDDQSNLQSKVNIEYEDQQTFEAHSEQSEIEEKTEKSHDFSEKFERVKTLDSLLDESEKKTDDVTETPQNYNDDVEVTEVKQKDAEFVDFNPAGRLRNQPFVIARSEKKKIKPTSEGLRKDNYSLQEEKERFYQHRSKSRSSFMPYLLLLVSVLTISYGIYYYLTNIKGVSHTTVDDKSMKFDFNNTNIIQRDFSFPVSYPYPKRTEAILDKIEIFDFKTTKPVTQIDAPEKKNTPETKEPEKLVVNNKPPEGAIKKLGINLFQYGNVYIVQVAAFRSISVAENEAGRFRNKGYNAFVERAEIDGRIWHRVKVGNFTDFREAEKFAVQFK